MPAERPKTLRKLKSVYDASPTDPPTITNTNLSSNGQADRNINGMEDEVRRRSNTTSSTHSGDKSLSILSPFDEQVTLNYYGSFLHRFFSYSGGIQFLLEIDLLKIRRL